ncbi:hypothetical protein [Kribbella italica]|uniref:Uncharacterized protein n=1 Tax=Kribbella italica TaxID=1540520 RepID=A0A7W9MS11_9ACTN|nr:hypothetical protein [Kribbella italica]MBB5833433.1 hypothetical protein [Kribbella italica]
MTTTVTEPMMFNEMRVKRVEVSVLAKFQAYVAVTLDDDGNEMIELPEGRIGYEIADAIEYYAAHTSDAQDGDALVALVGGGIGNTVEIEVAAWEVESDDTSADVQDAVDHTEAWKS